VLSDSVVAFCFFIFGIHFCAFDFFIFEVFACMSDCILLVIRFVLFTACVTYPFIFLMAKCIRFWYSVSSSPGVPLPCIVLLSVLLSVIWFSSVCFYFVRDADIVDVFGILSLC